MKVKVMWEELRQALEGWLVVATSAGVGSMGRPVVVAAEAAADLTAVLADPVVPLAEEPAEFVGLVEGQSGHLH